MFCCQKGAWFFLCLVFCFRCVNGVRWGVTHTHTHTLLCWTPVWSSSLSHWRLGRRSRTRQGRTDGWERRTPDHHTKMRRSSQSSHPIGWRETGQEITHLISMAEDFDPTQTWSSAYLIVLGFAATPLEDFLFDWPSIGHAYCHPLHLEVSLSRRSKIERS